MNNLIEYQPVYTALLSEFIRINTDFKNALKGFTEAQLFDLPSAGSWSAAQVAEHIILSDRSIADFAKGETTATERSPDESIPGLKKMFLDFTVKMDSPEFIYSERNF